MRPKEETRWQVKSWRLKVWHLVLRWWKKEMGHFLEVLDNTLTCRDDALVEGDYCQRTKMV